MAAAAKAPPSFARRDHLLALEQAAQARWAAGKEFESAAPPPPPAGEADAPKFMCTFPYPYMNGRLHLGHAFTVTKAEFAAGYQRLRGKNVLFPFAFHCTGMPIQAAANKLRREYETGAPAEVLKRLEEKAAGEGEEGEAAAPADATADTAAPAAAAAAAPEAALGGGGAAPAAEKALGKFTGKKTKAAAKSGGAAMTSFEILLKSGIPAADIPAFVDPTHWLRFFPPLGQADLTSMGLHTDWRRSFITTDANPYYDSFIRWQFNTLRARDKLGFGKRPTIYSVTDGQACADHDRASGEGVQPQEYTLIKVRLQGVPEGHAAGAAGRLAPLQALLAAGRPVFLVAATLRPETMYGQTNVFLLPSGEYGAYETSAGGEVFLCSERSARNMAYQGLSPSHGVTSCLGSFSGEDLLGLPLSAPLTCYPTVYTLPLLTISMKKGTGVVTSVPSDAPDDFAALRDLQSKPALREKYGLTEAMAAFPVVEIIDIPGYGRQAAVTVCESLKIKSQNDAELLKQAKDLVYQTGFYQGVMLLGPHAGKKVCDAKPLVRAELIAAGSAAAYWEPESQVLSRSGDECVVAELDQWYLKYGEEEWRGVVSAWVSGGQFATYNPACQSAFELILTWLKEWACSRSFGLGTRLPWDRQFVIESLSDSTVYMAYYTFAHLLHGGSLDGSVRGPLGLAPEQLTDAAWDYVLLGVEGYTPAEGSAPLAALQAMRREFTYWYPMDLRVSGKDLIQNHLTMSLYNHAAIWSQSETSTGMMPRGFFCNGHVLVDGDKMSKSKGNFIMLHEAIAKWSADATRLALADAGDGMEDANFESSTADAAILRLTTEEEWVKEVLAEEAAGQLRSGGADTLGYADRVFHARISQCTAEAAAGYEAMRYRDALKAAYFEMLKARDNYRDMCAKVGSPMHAAVLHRFVDAFYVMLAPICPHLCEHMWGSVLGHGQGGAASVTRAPWPSSAGAAGSGLAPEEEAQLLLVDDYLAAKVHAFRLTIAKLTVGKPGKAVKKEAVKAVRARVFLAADWPEWQKRPLQQLAELWAPPGGAAGSAGGFTVADPVSAIKDMAMADAALKPKLKNVSGGWVVGRWGGG